MADTDTALRTLVDGWYAVRIRGNEEDVWTVGKHRCAGYEFDYMPGPDPGVQWDTMEEYLSTSCLAEIGPFLMSPAGPSRELLDEVKQAKYMRDTFGGEDPNAST